MLKIPEPILKDIDQYKNKVESFKNGDLENTRFKVYRVPMGVYEERSLDIYMVRTRIPSGVLTWEQLKKIVELADKYSHGKIHLTTRQDIQFHKVELDDTVKVVDELKKVGIITRGTGGNTPRNVVCSPLSGVRKDEPFDPTPYALATTEYLLKDKSNFELPRKYKIVFSNTENDIRYAKVADLGFVATKKNGKLGFKLYGAGGLGNSSRASILLREFIPAEDFLYHVQGMKELFEAYSDRSNKHKARIRHIIERFGEEKFQKEYTKYVNKVKKDDIINNKELKNYNIDYISDEGEIFGEYRRSVIPEKVTGRYSIYVQPENGNVNTSQLKNIINAVDSLNYEPSIRLASTQGFYIREIDGKNVEKIDRVVREVSSGDIIDEVIACAGAATCKLGLCLSQNLSEAIINKFKDSSRELKNRLPKIYISGCPNSCGQHHIGEIGLYGKAKRVDGNLVPMYGVMFGNKSKVELSEELDQLPAKNIPDFLYDLAELKGDTDFYDLIENEIDKIQNLVDKYSDIPAFKENEELYKDIGKDELFSLKGRGPGECSAGVLDVIKLDISNAKSYLEDYKKDEDNDKLYNSAVSAFKSLLILKGVDTNKDRKIFKEFTKNFIKEEKYVKEDIEDTIDNLLDYKLGDIENISSELENIEYLVERISEMFASLSPKLEITVKKIDEVEEDSNKEKTDEKVKEKETESKLKIADLRGVKCPINFVKAKVEMSKIKSGEEIGIYLDDGAPINNVPGSIKKEGHKILEIDDSFDGYNLLKVKKK